MWKTIALILLFPIGMAGARESLHLQELKELYPYALLTDDFGILNKDDLRINQCIATPYPFSEDGSSSYPYWQCFDTKNVKMICEGNKYSREDKCRMTMLVLSGQRKNELNEFISRRPMKLSSCRLYRKEWLRLTAGEKHICISGEDITSEIDSAGKKKFVWIFDRYKTRKGCDSYFRGACILKESERCSVD